MTKKIYLRFLLAAIMLVMATSLTYTGSAQTQSSAQGDICVYCECNDGFCWCEEFVCSQGSVK